MNRDWDRVFDCLDRLEAYRPESPDEFDAACPMALAAARDAAGRLRSDGRPIPDDVFGMPDGGVMFLWVGDGGANDYFDFAPGGRVGRMKTFSDRRPAFMQQVSQ